MIIITARGYFRSRQPEWEKSASILIWGLVLLFNRQIFETSPSFAYFDAFMPREAWGAVYVMVGALRIYGLWLNGRRRLITSWVRVYSAIAGFTLFGGTSLAFALSGSWTTWLAIYPVLALGEAINAYYAVIDAGDATRQQAESRRHARSS